MSQCDNWPADDLRLYKQKYDNDDFDYLDYSFQMDALTPVNEEDLQLLRQMGVREIDELPQ